MRQNAWAGTGALKYDAARGGYQTNVTEAQLRDAPAFSDDSWSDRNWETRTHTHYNVRPIGERYRHSRQRLAQFGLAHAVLGWRAGVLGGLGLRAECEARFHHVL